MGDFKECRDGESGKKNFAEWGGSRSLEGEDKTTNIKIR